MHRDVTIHERAHAAAHGIAQAIEQGGRAIAAGVPDAQTCAIPGLLTGNADIHPLEA